MVLCYFAYLEVTIKRYKSLRYNELNEIAIFLNIYLALDIYFIVFSSFLFLK